MTTKATTINTISDFLGLRAMPGKGYWIAVCLAEFLVLWLGLACVSLSLNIKFRGRREDPANNTSEDTTSVSGVRTQDGAKFSAPTMIVPNNQDNQKTEISETATSAAKETTSSENEDSKPVSLDQSLNLTMVVKEINKANGNDQTLASPTQHQAKNNARTDSSVSADKKEFEYEVGVALSSSRRHSHVASTTDGQDGSHVAVDATREEEAEEYNEMQTEAGSINDRHPQPIARPAAIDCRDSLGEPSGSGGTTSVSCDSRTQVEVADTT